MFEPISPLMENTALDRDFENKGKKFDAIIQELNDGTFPEHRYVDLIHENLSITHDDGQNYFHNARTFISIAIEKLEEQAYNKFLEVLRKQIGNEQLAFYLDVEIIQNNISRKLTFFTPEEEFRFIPQNLNNLYNSNFLTNIYTELEPTDLSYNGIYADALKNNFPILYYNASHEDYYLSFNLLNNPDDFVTEAINKTDDHDYAALMYLANSNIPSKHQITLFETSFTINSLKGLYINEVQYLFTCKSLEDLLSTSINYDKPSVFDWYLRNIGFSKNDYSKRFDDNMTILHYAAKKKCSYAIEEMFKDPRAQEIILLTDSYGNTPLHYVCKNKCVNILPKLLENEQSRKALKMQNKRGETPLHCFCGRRDFHNQNLASKILEYQEAQEAILLTDKDGNTLLHFLTIRAEKALIQILLKYPEGRKTISVKDSDGYTPLCNVTGQSKLIELIKESDYNSFLWAGLTGFRSFRHTKECRIIVGNLLLSVPICLLSYYSKLPNLAPALFVIGNIGLVCDTYILRNNDQTFSLLPGINR